MVIQGFLTWIEEFKFKEDLKNEDQEMELALVKAKLAPHFLINTVNNVDIIIRTLIKVTNNKERLSEYFDQDEEGNIGYVAQFGFFPNMMYRVCF